MSYRIGLDVGIASVGYSILKTDSEGNPFRIEHLNAVIFDRAEQPKTGASLAAPRREKRGLRRRTRRTKFRKHRTKQLFLRYNILKQVQLDDIFTDEGTKTVHQLRYEALDRKLEPQEFFRILYYFAGHRGFKSNRKSEHAEKDNQPVLAAIREINTRMVEANYRTLGEYIVKDELFQSHVRNKEHTYLATAERSLIVSEVKTIFETQRALGNAWAFAEMEEEYLGTADHPGILTAQRDFDEGPGAQSPYAGDQIEKMVGNCTFEESEKRAPKASYTFQYFDLLCKLNNLRISHSPGSEKVGLTEEQHRSIIDKAFSQEKVTFTQLKKLLDLEEEAEFNLLSYSEKKDRKKTENTLFYSMKAYHAMQKAMGESFDSFSHEELNVIASILTNYSSDRTRTQKFEELTKLTPTQIAQLLPLTFAKFSNLSIKAMNKMIPFLEQGLLYNEAASEAGYDFKYKKIDSKLIRANVANPVVKRAVTKTIKVVNQIIRTYGEPDAIHIELAREIGRSFDDRRKIQKSQDDNKARNERLAKEIQELGFPVNGENITRLKLWQQQKGDDLYSGERIHMDRLFTAEYDVDHIIPYSQCFDDTFSNKVVTSAKCNREKRNRLPMEYLANDPERLETFTVLANGISQKRKRDRLLKKKASEDEIKEWKARNLQDTQYISKLLKSFFEQNITFSQQLDRKQRVFVGNGTITARLRARWGLTKVREDGDKHHALDATVVACVTPTLTRMLTLYSRRQELRYNPDVWKLTSEDDEELGKLSPKKRDEYRAIFSKQFPQPWVGFREELIVRLSDNPKELIRASGYEPAKRLYTDEEIENLKPIFVVRLPKRKISGAAHEDTIRSGALREEGKTISRISISKLKLNSEGEITYGSGDFYKSSDNGWKVVYDALKTELLKHGGDGAKAFPEGMFQFENNGSQQTVRKVRVVQSATLQVPLDHGKSVADNGSMVRIDVFKTPKKYVFVPIYVKDTIADELPNRAVVASKKFEEWHIIDNDEFLFSLYPRDMVHIQTKSGIRPIYRVDKKKGTTLIKDFWGYFNSASISTGSINVISHDGSYTGESIGVAKLLCFEKYSIDYLGNYHKITESKRQGFK